MEGDFEVLWVINKNAHEPFLFSNFVNYYKQKKKDFLIRNEC
jgi:hypothetical protein